MKISVLILFFALASCAHRPPPSHGKTLFPEGTYKHAVQIQMKDQSPYPANGVLRLDRESLKLFLLGPMDVTVLKITETFANDNVEFVNHLPQFKDHEFRMKRVYDIVRTFILFPRDKEKWGPLKTTKVNEGRYPEVLKGPHDLMFYVDEFKNNHPTKFRIEHPQFSATLTEH